MRTFSAHQLEQLIAGMSMPVYAPVEVGNTVIYAPYEVGKKLRLDKVGTDKTPKEVFFPQWENLMHFRMEGKKIELTEEERANEDYVLFGVRACDMQAIRVLDKVFLADPVDTFYAARRAHGIIVGLACDLPGRNCFCKNFGIDPAQPDGDIVLWPAGDIYYCEAYSEKGNALLNSWVTEEADEAAVGKIKEIIGEKYDALPFAHLNLTGFDGAHLMEKFESPRWKKLAMACLGCGTCTFSCPTCQCYDIRDYDTGKGIQRYRCWDSCMYSDFTLMAHGTSRPTQLERFRQRFMHKLVYFPSRNDGLYACVGCGRCIEKCPVKMNIVKVIRALGEGEGK